MNKHRIVVDVPDNLADKLDDVASLCGTTRSDVIRKAILLIDIFTRAHREGSKITVQKRNGEKVDIVLGL